jgi:hypothetical protein
MEIISERVKAQRFQLFVQSPANKWAGFPVLKRQEWASIEFSSSWTTEPTPTGEVKLPLTLSSPYFKNVFLAA